VNEPPIIWREPENFAPGDSLIFQRSLPAYLPSDGWQVQGTVSLPTANGAKIITQYTSQPDATGKFHVVTVLNFLQGAANGDYILTEEIACQAGGVNPGEKHQIYYAELEVGPDLADGLAVGPITSHAQRSLVLLEARLEELFSHNLTETELERSRLIIVQRKELEELRKHYKEERDWELRTQRQVNTGQDQVNIHPVMNGNW
jgi:hypothetical protein